MATVASKEILFIAPRPLCARTGCPRAPSKPPRRPGVHNEIQRVLFGAISATWRSNEKCALVCTGARFSRTWSVALPLFRAFFSRHVPGIFFGTHVSFFRCHVATICVQTVSQICRKSCKKESGPHRLLLRDPLGTQGTPASLL